jgi:hypothetical protein
MLDRISETIWAIVTSIPAWLVPEGSQNFMAIRAMFGLLFIVLIVYLIAMRPSLSNRISHAKGDQPVAPKAVVTEPRWAASGCAKRTPASSSPSLSARAPKVVRR